jgi:hypothetical protein
MVVKRVPPEAGVWENDTERTNWAQQITVGPYGQDILTLGSIKGLECLNQLNYQPLYKGSEQEVSHWIRVRLCI